MKVYDTFLFFNELELLELRLKELDSVVDYFVLVEATTTFTENPKKLFFDENKTRFQKYLPKIIHVIVDDAPNNGDAWENEYFQRNAIMRGLENATDEDVIIISDVDEIPNPKKIKEYIKKEENEVKVFEQKLYYYYVNCLQAQPWYGSIITRKSGLTAPQKLRDVRTDLTKIVKGGWHFSFLGGTEKIIEKIKAYAETQTNTEKTTSEKFLKKTIDECGDIFEREDDFAKKRIVELDETFPENISWFIEKYPNAYKKPSEKKSYSKVFFSILVPTYNQTEYLREALDSLLKQTYSDWEALVVDDGSTDNTFEILKEYAEKDSRFRIFKKENGGTGSALNEGLRHARGEWICWLSTDDLFVENKLEVHKKAIEENPEIKFFYSHYYVLDDDRKELIAPESAQTQFYLPPFQVMGFALGNYINGLSIAIKREVFDALGPFDETIRYGQDYDMWLRIVSKYPARFVNERTIVTRIYSSQVTSANPELGILDSTRALINFINRHKFEDFFPLLDFSKFEHISFAIEQTLFVSLNPDSFIYKGIFSTALLERFKEWLYTLPEIIKPQIKKYLQSYLENAERMGIFKRFPKRTADCLRALPGALHAKVIYEKHNFLSEIEEAVRQNCPKGVSNEFCEKLNNYLNKISEHYNKLINVEKLIPERIVEYDNLYKGKGAEEAELINVNLDISPNGTKLIYKIKTDDGKYGSVIRDYWFLDKVTPFEFNDPFSGKKKYVDVATIFKTWLRGYDFNASIEQLENRIRNGEKITFAFTVLTPSVKGGGTSNVFTFAKFVSMMGYEVTIYSDEEEPSWHDCDCNFVFEKEVKKRYSEISEDVVIFFSISELSPLLAYIKNKKAVVLHFCQGVETFHYSAKNINDLLAPKPYFELMHRLPVGRITVSESLRDYFLKNFGQKTFLIRNGIDDKFFRDEIRDRNYDVEEFVLLFVGNPNFYLKGFETLSETVLKLVMAMPDKKFTVKILDGNAGNEEKEQIVDNVSIIVKNCYDVDCMINEYDNAHVYVNSSYYEGFGLPTLEAMARGLPVVQTDNMGLDGIVKDKNNCLIVPPGDSDKLFEAVFALINDSKLREKIIKGGKKTAINYTKFGQKTDFFRVFSDFSSYVENYSLIKKRGAIPSEVEKLSLMKKKTNERPETPVDIVFLTHNRLEYFKRTINVLIKNTRYPYRIIIVDNASDDEFKTYLKQAEILFDKIIHNEKNEWTKAFQKGIEFAESDPFIVSDPDILVPNLADKCWLEKIVELHKTYPEMGLIALNLDSSNKPAKMPDVYIGEKTEYNGEIVLANVGTVMQSIKRKYFDFEYETDWETCERIRRNGGKVGFAKNIVAYHLGWNEEKDYPDYMVEKYKYFKGKYKVDTYKLYTEDENILEKMDDANVESEYYSYDRPEVRKLVKKSAKKILDVGCASGALGEKLKEELGAEVWGIELFEKAAKVATKKLDKVLIGDVIRKSEELPEDYFDTIIFADVLEHLAAPEKALRKISKALKSDGEIIVSIPNVRHWTVIKALLEGTWHYEEAGILDKTHLRFFTLETATKMLEECGFETKKIEATALDDYKFPESLIEKLSEEGFSVGDLREKSYHYQYILKAGKKNGLIASVIVPVYNQAELTVQMLNSLRAEEKKNIETIIIDNASDSETKNILENFAAEHRNVILIRNEKNLGFPKAVNQGLKVAKGEYVFIANNDIILPPDWLEKMIEHADKSDEIGLVGPVSNEVSGVQKVKVKYDSLEEMFETMKTIADKNDGQFFEFPRIAFLFTLVKRKVLETIGGLDERFSPGNYEDDDYCLRAQLAGFKTIIALDVFVHHYGSASFNASGKDKYVNLLKTNEAKFVKKWGHTPDEIWLENKTPFENELYFSLTGGDFARLIKEANEAIEKNEFTEAKDLLARALENFDENYGISREKLAELLNKIKMAIGKK